MNIILFGATGMVGQGVLRECLLDPSVQVVKTLGRTATGVQHPKLLEIVHTNRFPQFSKSCRKKFFELLVNLELKIIIDQIRSLNKSIAELEETIGKQGQKLEGHKNLTSIKGIGGLSGGILLSIIGDVGDFADEGKLAAYFGIVPRVSNSNETEHSRRITKRGTKLGRTTLIQCALIAQRYSPYLKLTKSLGRWRRITPAFRKSAVFARHDSRLDW